MNNAGLTDSERELLQRFAEDNLSRAEYEFVQRRLETDSDWRQTLSLLRQELAVSADGNPARETTEIEKEKTTEKRMAPPRWMLIVMIVGWVVLFVIVFSMMMDVDRRLLEIEEQERIQRKRELPEGK